MPAGSRRFWRDDVLAGAWRWLLVILVLLLIVPLPGPSVLHARSAAYVSKSSAAATAVRFALDQLGKRYRWGGAGPMAYDCSGLTMMAYRSATACAPRRRRRGCWAWCAMGSGAPAWPRSRAACAPPVPAWRWTAPSGPSRSPRCGASSAPTAWLPTGRSVAPPGPPLSATDASGADRRPAERSTSTTRSGRGAVRPDRVAQTPRGGSAPARTDRPAGGGPPPVAFRGTNGQRRGQCGHDDESTKIHVAVPPWRSQIIARSCSERPPQTP